MAKILKKYTRRVESTLPHLVLVAALSLFPFDITKIRIIFHSTKLYQVNLLKRNIVLYLHSWNISCIFVVTKTNRDEQVTKEQQRRVQLPIPLD